MALHKIRKGLNLPITGAPEQTIEDAPQPSHVALVAADYVGMKPTMHVSVGEPVSRGQLLFEDKKTPGVLYTSPGGGKVVGIHRGARRALLSVVIELSSAERGNTAASKRFASFTGRPADSLSREQVRDLLVESGMWPSLRTRPFGRVPEVESEPKSIFVTIADTQPLAPDVNAIMAGQQEAFLTGLDALAKLTSGTVYLCGGDDVHIPIPRSLESGGSSGGSGGASSQFRIEHFAGPHPSGTAGVHIHTLDPVHRGKTVWYTNYQEVIAIGRLFLSGELDTTRVIALAGPSVARPRLLRTRLGASTDDLVRGQLVTDEAAATGSKEADEVEHRIVSGSVLSGRKAQGEETGFLGRFHHQISVLEEGRHREFLGWLGPGFDKFSVVNTFLSKLIPGKKFAFDTNQNGSHRAIVPIGMYEKVFPIDIPPSFLLRALVMHDVEQLEKLGILELEEEDVALCSFVCPGKIEYGPHLREVLTTIEKEG